MLEECLDMLIEGGYIWYAEDIANLNRDIEAFRGQMIALQHSRARGKPYHYGHEPRKRVPKPQHFTRNVGCSRADAIHLQPVGIILWHPCCGWWRKSTSPPCTWLIKPKNGGLGVYEDIRDRQWAQFGTRGQFKEVVVKQLYTENVNKTLVRHSSSSSRSARPTTTWRNS